MGSVHESPDTGALPAGQGAGRPRTLAGKDGPEAADEVLAQEGVVTSQAGQADDEEEDDEDAEPFDVDSATVDELREQAARRNVEGRSSMTKAELQDALR